jgi:hypothetical protein
MPLPPSPNDQIGTEEGDGVLLFKKIIVIPGQYEEVVVKSAL